MVSGLVTWKRPANHILAVKNKPLRRVHYSMYYMFTVCEIRRKASEMFLNKIGKLKMYQFLGLREPYEALKCVNKIYISCAW